MSSRPPGWPMRSSRSATAAWTTCGQRAVKVSQAGRHEPGAAPAEPLIPSIRDGEELLHPLLDGRMEIGCVHAPAKVAAWHTFTGRSARDQRGDAISRPADDRLLVIWGTR